jgi:hypothetical protein
LIASLSRLLRKVVEGADVSEQLPTLFFEEGPTSMLKKGRAQNG